jgi:hypothetical protein
MGRKGHGVKTLPICRLIGRWRIVEADLRDRAIFPEAEQIPGLDR